MSNLRDSFFEVGMVLMLGAGTLILLSAFIMGTLLFTDWITSLNITYNAPYPFPVMVLLMLTVLGLIGAFLVVAGSIERKEKDGGRP